MAVITISRQSGSEGNEITQILCDRLGYRYFDKNMMAQLASEMGMKPDQVVDISADQYHAKSFLEKIFGAVQLPFGDYTGAAYLVEVEAQQALTVERVRNLILTAYERDNAIIVGRGGQVTLADKPDVLHVRIVAPLETRIKRWQAREGLTAEEARQKVLDRDAAHIDFVKRFYDAELSDPTLYDLVINTEKLTPAAAASLIIKALEHIPARGSSHETK